MTAPDDARRMAECIITNCRNSVSATEPFCSTHRAAPAADETELDRLREVLQRISEGDEPRKFGKFYFPDERFSKHNKCKHAVWMYETCGNCIADYARAALAASSSPVQG